MFDLNYTFSSHERGEVFHMDLDRYTKTFDGNVFTFYAYETTTETLWNAVNKARDLLLKEFVNVRWVYTTSTTVIITAENNKDDRMIVGLDANERDEYGDIVHNEDENQKKPVMDLAIHAIGTHEDVSGFSGPFVDMIKSERIPRINWHYKAHGRSTKTFYLRKEDVKPLRDSYYPYIKPGVREFFREYLASSASILILLGEPGTGKTSFIRSMIQEFKMDTDISYDEDIMASDDYFISFLTSKRTDLLVIEDADLLLTDRNNDGNKVMSKLLNVSDGLVKIVKKKMIFTANITNVNKIDHAILRPGRCFDVIDFRKLTNEEAYAAAADAGIENPSFTGNDIPLTEVFNEQAKFKRGFGFNNR